MKIVIVPSPKCFDCKKLSDADNTFCFFQPMDGDFPDPNYNMPPGGYGYPHDGFDYNQPMDYSHDPGYDFHHQDPSMQPLAHPGVPPPRGGTWYDTDL